MEGYLDVRKYISLSLGETARPIPQNVNNYTAIALKNKYKNGKRRKIHSCNFVTF